MIRPRVLSFAMAIALAWLAWPEAHAQGSRPAPGDDSPAPGKQPGLAQELRGDIGSQGKISDIDKQIEQTWKTVEEIRESAIRLKLAHAQLKDALENSDCGVASKMLVSLKRSQDSLTRLGTSLDEQCKDVDQRVQRQLAQACTSERKTLETESAALKRQQDQVLGMCPDLRKAQ